MDWRKQWGFGAGGLVLLAVLFLGVVMLSNAGLRGMRVDLTQNKLYTLSSGTQQVLRELKEPVDLYLYFSRDVAAKHSPLIQPYATRVREFLEELAARAGGKIRLHVIDPQAVVELPHLHESLPDASAGATGGSIGGGMNSGASTGTVNTRSAASSRRCRCAG